MSLRVGVIISCAGLAGLALLWLAAGRSLSILLDRVYLTQASSTNVSEIRFDNGTLVVAGSRLDSLTTETLPSGLQVLLDPSGRATLVHQGRTFTCGPGASQSNPQALPDFTFQPDAGDTVTFVVERSLLSWPTPFEMNFMTGSAPSWRRHAYCRLTWRKQNGATLAIVWRVQQGFFQETGWRPASMDFVTAGLQRVDITASPAGE